MRFFKQDYIGIPYWTLPEFKQSVEPDFNVTVKELCDSYFRPIEFDMNLPPWKNGMIPPDVKSHPAFICGFMTACLKCCLVTADDSFIAKVTACSDIPAENRVQIEKFYTESYRKKRETYIHEPQFQNFVRSNGDGALAEIKKDYQHHLDKTKNARTADLYRHILGKLDGAYEDLKNTITIIMRTTHVSTIQSRS